MRPPVLARLADRDRSQPLIAAHRGDSERHPENTLPAFAAAVAVGADLVECDVHLTRDGRLAVIHDERLERTTNGSGPVAAHTLAELRQLDAGGWRGVAHRGARIPTLAEVLELARGRCAVAVEIKARPTAAADPVRAVVLALRGAGMEAESLVLAFDHRVTLAVRATGTAAATGVVMVGRPVDPVGVVRAGGGDGLVTEIGSIDRELARALHAAGAFLAVATVNDAAELAAAAAAEVDLVITDRPATLVRPASAPVTCEDGR